MLWLNDSCQNKISADQYHTTILRFQVQCPGPGFDWTAGLSQVITLGEKEGVRPKANPCVLLIFLSRYSLHNHLLESP